MINSNYIQYGCGLSAPIQWKNFDASPTLRIQKMPIVGKVMRKSLNVEFPKNVLFGDIIKGLPVEKNSCQGVYCSHTLEHLALEDFRVALKNTFLIMKDEAIFRCIVPDLEWAAKEYVKGLEMGNDTASISFINNTILGIKKRPRGISGLLNSFFGNSHHLWMWDYNSLSKELRDAGFRDIRKCHFNDSEDKMFNLVESEGRFVNAVSIQCKK